MRRNVFLSNNGMNENIYIGEDKQLFENLKEKVKNFKALFSPDIFVYHKQRKILKFLLQRFSYGTVLIESVTFSDGLKGFIPGIPIASFFIFLIFIFSNLSFIVKTYIFITFFLFVNLLILYEINKPIKNFKDKAYTLLIINLANMMHIFGGLIALLGLRKIFSRKTFVLSRSNL